MACQSTPPSQFEAGPADAGQDSAIIEFIILGGQIDTQRLGRRYDARHRSASQHQCLRPCHEIMSASNDTVWLLPELLMSRPGDCSNRECFCRHDRVSIKADDSPLTQADADAHESRWIVDPAEESKCN